MDDSASVAEHLYAEFIPEATRRLIRNSLSGDDAEGSALVQWLAGIHDIGKATPEFCSQVRATFPTVCGHMRDLGLSLGSFHETLGHPALGQHVLNEWLKTSYDPARGVRDTFSCVVGGHHGRNPGDVTLGIVRQRPDALGDGQWPLVREEILDRMAVRTGAAKHLKTWMQRPLPAHVASVVTGLVIMADWIASNQDLFPYGDPSATHDRTTRAMRTLGLPRPWLPPARDGDALTLFASRFPALTKGEPNNLQRTVVALAQTISEPGLLIIEAPMGSGKTESALLATEVLAARFGFGGAYLGLPTMATANPMFQRVLDWLGEAIGGHDASISLAHGKAGLNDRFRGVQASSRIRTYDDEVRHPQVLVNSWLRGRKRAALASFVVGTVDQGLFGALKAKHVALRHLGLAGKVVVIDEVHAADAYMREYLLRLLEWLGAFSTPVILMSATLPPAQREQFVQAYAQGRGHTEVQPPDSSDEYPRLTVWPPHEQPVSVPSDEAATVVSTRHLGDDDESLVALLTGQLADGGCAGVICNTVSRAQEAYEALDAAFPGQVTLLHSRFIAPSRAAREMGVVDQLGRTGDRPQRMIVVGTQVLEQSLDIDFDLMVSDLAPVDLLLQRAGRLHRHTRRRPPLLVRAQLFLRGVEDWGATPPTNPGSSRAIYGESALLRSAVLMPEGEIRLPEDIPSLVRRAYSGDFESPAGWEAAMERAEQAQAREDADARQKASTFLMPSPHQMLNLNNMMEVTQADPERGEQQGTSQVRDSEDSLEVIALVRDGAGTLRLPASAPAHAEAVVPSVLAPGLGEDESLARAMASCTLPLPASLTKGAANFDTVVCALESHVDASGWQKSTWLAGQLVLAFDHTGRAELGAFTLYYDDRLGLVVRRREETS